MNNADSESQSLIAQLLLLVALTFINAFLVVAEIAVVSANRNRAEQKAEDGDAKAQKLLKVLQDPNSFLSTIQVGITLVNILSGASLAETLSSRLASILGGGAAARSLAGIIILTLLTYVSTVFSELHPRRIAMNKSEEVTQLTSGAVRFLGVTACPFVWLLSASTDLLSRITPMTFDDADSKVTRDKMRYTLETEGVLEDEELEMLQGVFSLDTKVAREVMAPRTDTFMVDIQDNVQESINLILGENYSRTLAYSRDKDKIVGILHTRTLLKAARNLGFENIELGAIIQEPLFVPGTIFIDDLLYESKRAQNQTVILLDEHDGVVGLATLEDLLEGIVGEIDDETDEVENLYTQVADNEYLVQGRMLIGKFNEVFEIDLHMSDVDTMAGYLTTALGTIPDEGEKSSFEIGNIKLAAEEMEGIRLLVSRVHFYDEETVDEEPEENRRFFRKEMGDDEPRR